MKGIKKGLAILLVLCTLLSMVVMTGAGTAPQSADAGEAQTMAANGDFMKMVLLDGGRGHISVENVKAVINEMALYDYDYLMLGIGNDGLRFLLDDMSVTANDQTYSGETIKNAIVAKNNDLAPQAMGEWSEGDMNAILAYAQEKGISIVPMLNTPGHATSIVAAMTACGITNCSLASSGTDTKNITINIENEQAAAFAKALVKKYITWFSSRGCTYFNLGCDEYGGNAGNTQDKTNQAITAYVTDLCNAMTAMTPMAFTDVLCACSNVPDNLVGIHWYKNKLQNNSNVRANSNWYYVVGTHGTGNPNEWATYEKALKCVATDRVAQDYDGSLLAIWNDYNNPFTAEEVENVKTLIRTQATSNPDYFTVEQPEQPDPDYDKEIRVVIGQTSEITIEDVNYANDGPYTTDDPSIATVEVTGQDAVEATTIHTKVTSNPSWESLIGSDGGPTATNYWYESGGAYYQLYVSRSTVGGISPTRTYTLGFYPNGSTQLEKVEEKAVDGHVWGAWYDDAGSVSATMYTQSTTPATPASTTITFTGVNPGTTYVTVGDTTYKIVVLDEDVTTVSPLKVHLRITTFPVWAEGDSAKVNYRDISAEAIHSEEGVALSDLVPNPTDWEYEGKGCQTVFWRGTVLPEGKHQSTDTQNDRTGDGTSFTKLRRWDKEWQYFSEKDNSWKTIIASDEVVAYYLQSTEVTDEVTTMVKDWGFKPEDAYQDDGATNRQVALSFAVVYSTGQLSPSEENIMNQSTIIYHLHSANNPRDIGLAYIANTEGYEVSKITWTAGTRDQNKTSAWTANDTVTWNKTTADGVTWYDETTIWTNEDGTDPVIRGTEIDYQWQHAGDACLILIYVKARADLTVRYWDDSAGTEIYNYGIAVDSNVNFNNGLHPALTNDDLDDNAYIVNYKNQNETFQKDLTQIPDLHGKYASGLYRYVKADISADGKTLTLHYNLDSSKLSRNYVVDFGLPVEIPISDLVEKVDTISSVQIANNIATYDGTKKVIRYKPASVFTGTVTLSVTVTFVGNAMQTFTVGLTPATTVYYEEGFGTFPAGSITGSSNDGNQAAEAAGGQKHVYGYDDAYTGSVGDSNGTVAELKTGAQGTFTFTGTGVDVYARTETNSGKVMVYVYDGPTLKRLITVDTRQLGPQSANGTAYNVPIVSLSGLSAGEHTIRMLAVQTKDENGTKQSWPVYIDGFRVHGTLDVNSEVYHQDGEANPTFVELRNSVLNAVIGDTKPDSIYADQIANETMSQVYAANEEGVSALIVTRDSTMTDVEVKDLLDNGPKNEIYLKQGEALVFTVNAASAQIGLKALNKETSYKINSGEPVSLSTSTDMFYPVNTSVITITNTGDGILSVTELKLFGADTSTATVEPMSAPALTRALVSLGFESEPVAATATLNITVQCGDKAVPVTLTHDGMSNETHTFTAAEIKAAVEQALPEGYTVADVTFSDVTVACGEASDVAFTAAETPAPAGLLQKIVQIAVKIVKKIFSWF